MRRTMIQEEERTCGDLTDFQVIDEALRDEVTRAVRYASSRDLHGGDGTAFDRLAQMVRQIEKRLHSAPEVVAECPFEGYAEVATEAGAAIWTCPTCDREHHEEPE